VKELLLNTIVKPGSLWALALMLLVAAPGTAEAHARLKKSSPEANAVLDRPPGVIDLWFSELLDGNFDYVEVYPAAEVGAKTRRNLAKAEAKRNENDHTRLTLALKPLPPGEYAVEWRVLSLDGHTATGRFKFKVREPK
jgi:methionine-rich copper-binding protein CopC